MEWGLDALLFSFSSSVKGKKKEWPSGKVKGLSTLPRIPMLASIRGNLKYWCFESNDHGSSPNMLDIFLNKEKRGNWPVQKTFRSLCIFIWHNSSWRAVSLYHWAIQLCSPNLLFFQLQTDTWIYDSDPTNPPFAPANPTEQCGVREGECKCPGEPG